MTKNSEIPAGYKDSPLGIIPQEWEVKRLREIFTEARLGGNYENVESHTGIPVIKMGNIGRGKMIFDKMQYLPTGEQYSNSDILKYGDLLFNTRNTLDLVGKVAIWRDELPFAIYNSNLLRIYFDARFVYSNEYMNIAFNSYLSIKQLRGYATGTTSVAAIYSRDLFKMKFPLPPLAEQERIAEILGLWDEAIERQAKMITLLETRKRALMQQLFTPKPHWKTVSYSDLLKEIKRSLKWDDNELYTLISVKRRSGGLFKRESLYGHDIKTKNLRPVHVGDFLISKMQIVHGASGLTTSEFHNMKISGSYIALITKDKSQLNMIFLNWWSKMPKFYHQTYISSYGVHIEKMTFDLQSFMALGMKLPPIVEQQSIADKLSAADKEIELAKRCLELYRTQKRGLMQQLLTGKTRVKI